MQYVEHLPLEMTLGRPRRGRAKKVTVLLRGSAEEMVEQTRNFMRSALVEYAGWSKPLVQEYLEQTESKIRAHVLMQLVLATVKDGARRVGVEKPRQ